MRVTNNTELPQQKQQYVATQVTKILICLTKSNYMRQINVIPFPPHANIVAHGLPVRRLGGGGKSNYCFCCYCEVDEKVIPNTANGFG